MIDKDQLKLSWLTYLSTANRIRETAKNGWEDLFLKEAWRSMKFLLKELEKDNQQLFKELKEKYPED